MKKRKVIVIGGGAAGIVAAISAAREGADVTIIEQKDRIGKKILSTGNGRCNLTNEDMQSACFRGDDTSIVSDVLGEFGYKETIQFFKELGVIFKNRKGYIYPFSDQASTILNVLRMELERLEVSVRENHAVTAIKKNTKGFVVSTNKGTCVADALILATGSKAAPVLGSDGSGYQFAKNFGHHLSPVVPALVQLKGKGDYFKHVAGIRTQAKVSLYVDGKLEGSDTGELQLTNYGISGIPVFQISRYAAKGLYYNKQVVAEIDFLPDMTQEECLAFFKQRMKIHGYKTAADFFVGIFHKNLITMLLKEAHISGTMQIDTVKNSQLENMFKLCKSFMIEIIGTNDFEQAQICAGGVKTTEINPKTMESLYEPDFYLAGEILDVDGICGGYNLQWAWSTGFIAGKNAAKGWKE